MGQGLHTGAPARVTLSRRPGPVALRSAGFEASVAELSVVSSHRSTTVEACGGRLKVAMVEHVFAALAGVGIHENVVLEIEGPEMPLLDGGAGAWCEALALLDVAPLGPRLRIARAAVLEIGTSRYDLVPGEGIDVQVVVELESSAVEPFARWDGDADDFKRRIAPSRTFAQMRDLEELARSGLSRHVAPEAVVVIAPDALHGSGRPVRSDEPACHKLLDLMGDCYLFGGPPLGSVRAFRPGHRANTLAFARAVSEGIFRLEAPVVS
jgi:UDP-3-O-[3-hydroxymyristoyl] N-acetylglucosamine deacetylase